jgi:hypothetical protein
MGSIITVAVKRKDECLAAVTKKALLHNEGRQVGFERSAAYRSADRNVDIRIRAGWQSCFTSPNLMDLLGITRSREGPEGGQSFRRKLWPTSGRRRGRLGGRPGRCSRRLRRSRSRRRGSVFGAVSRVRVDGIDDDAQQDECPDTRQYLMARHRSSEPFPGASHAVEDARLRPGVVLARPDSECGGLRAATRLPDASPVHERR